MFLIDTIQLDCVFYPVWQFSFYLRYLANLHFNVIIILFRYKSFWDNYFDVSTWLGHDSQVSGLDISLVYVRPKRALDMSLEVSVKVFFKWD